MAKKKGLMRTISSYLLITLFVIFTAISCSTDPSPIRYGDDKCAYCQMMIANPNYGAELVTQKGRIYKFDAIECLVNYQTENSHQYQHILAVPFDRPKQLYPIDSLTFIISKQYKSPMGENIAAFLRPDSAQVTGQRYPWAEVKKTVLD